MAHLGAYLHGDDVIAVCERHPNTMVDIGSARTRR